MFLRTSDSNQNQEQRINSPENAESEFLAFPNSEDVRQVQNLAAQTSKRDEVQKRVEADFANRARKRREFLVAHQSSEREQQ
ncbi:MAG: hypothetical protein IPJ30_16450 [Acidobacteria bacterium]|nr:hypothetical protein [Acidobacteriota bacterium]